MNRSDHEIWEKVRKEVCSTCSDEYCGPYGGWKFCREFAELFLERKAKERRTNANEPAGT